MRTRTKDGRFHIDHSVRSDDSYMHSYTTETWAVESNETGEEVARFSGSDDADAAGSLQSGVRNVSFSADERSVVVTHGDGTVAHIELPIRYQLSDDERELVIVFRDGREQRELLAASWQEEEELGVVVSESTIRMLQEMAAERIARIKQKLAQRVTAD